MGRKILIQPNPLVLTGRYQLTQVDLFKAIKWSHSWRCLGICLRIEFEIHNRLRLIDIPIYALTSNGRFLSISALTLLVRHQEEHLACENWMMSCLWLSVWIEVQIVCVWSNWCHCIPKPHRVFPHLNLDWFYLFGSSLPMLSWNSSH